MRALVLLLAFFILAPETRAANVLVTGASKDQISIRTNFAGEKLLLFGAIDTAPYGPVDGVVVVLRGPGENVVLRKKQKQFGIWINNAGTVLGPLPSFYTVVSSAPLASLAPQDERITLGIGADTLDANLISSDGDSDKAAAKSAAQKAEALAAFRRLKQGDNLFAARDDAVEIINNKLFRAEITLPAGMPVGRYVTEFFAFKSGRLVGYQTGELPVDIVGAGHILHTAAYDAPLLYGLFGVIMALIMGWSVALIFGRR